MKKNILLLLLCFGFGFAQNKNAAALRPLLPSPSSEMKKGTTNTMQGSSICSASVVPPATVNGVYVTGSYTGSVSYYPNAYPVCTTLATIPESSIWLGQSGPFTYTFNFNQPVNNLVIALTAAGGFGNVLNENFIFVTNTGIPTISTSGMCYSTIIGNEILSGEGAIGGPDLISGGGGIFTITAQNNFTSMVISGDGGDNGTLLAICSNSVQTTVCNSGSAAPIVNSPTLCGATTINLNAVTSSNLPLVNGVSLAWFTGTPISGANQLTTAQAASQPLNTTYYAAFYDSINNCYSPPASFYPANTIPVAPTFTLPNEICFGDPVAGFPMLSNEGISGTWSPAVNNTESTVYMFTPNANQCALSTVLNVTVNKRPTVHIEAGCNGKDYELTAVSDIVSNVAYQWLDANSNIVGTNSSFIPDHSGAYQLIVTNVNCGGMASVNALNLYCDIQKGISPNNDGLNDFFELTNLNVSNLSIFNRYGMKVYTKTDYKNEWNGNTNSGVQLPDGVYYYVIEFKNGENKTGWIYLNRK